MWRVLAAVASVAVTYLIFALDLTRPMKNLVVGLLCLTIAMIFLGVAHLRTRPAMVSSAVALLPPTSLWLVFLTLNVLLGWDIPTLVLWALLLVLPLVGQIVWARVGPFHDKTSI